MAVYICKCGRQVNKSTNADNTGNRDTAGCTGCPYLLPWGPDRYIEGQGFRKDVQGYECRMSPTISYTTTYRGQANDKCTLHIPSLDLDFLDTVQAWIDDHAAATLSAGFSRGSMRGTDFSDKGRYSLSISCAQNKKGMAAKAALIEQFFTGGRVRRDMTLAQEKAHILTTIRHGKEQAQRKDQLMKKQNNRCPLQQECERTCKVIGHERDCDYYVNNRFSCSGIPDQDEILTEEELRRERELEEKRLADLSLAPTEPVTYTNEYGTIFAVREHKGKPALMCKAQSTNTWALSGVLASVQGEAYTAEDLQEVLDEYARAHGWKKATLENPENPTNAAPASPADAGVAQQSLCAAGPAALEVGKDTNVPTFDYSGLDNSTSQVVRANTSEFARHMLSSAEEYANACINAANVNKALSSHYQGKWGEWCEGFGLSHGSAQRMVDVGRSLLGDTKLVQLVSDGQIGKSLLQAISAPSAPAELVQAVKDGDITTHKQYQDALAEIRARDAKIKDLLEMSEAADRRADEEERKRKEANEARVAAENKVQQYREIKDAALETAKQQREKTAAAESRARAAEQERDEARKERDGAKSALQASKLRGDRLKAENDDLKARPIEVPVVDEEEIDRRARIKADELTAPLREELETLRSQQPTDLEEAEQAIQNAYDGTLYAGRTMENAWNALRPLLACMDASRRRLAIQQLRNTLSKIQGEIELCL